MDNYIRNSWIISTIKNDENYGMLADRLSEIGAELIVKTLDGMEEGNLKGIPQDESKVTLAPKLKSGDYKIDWNKTGEQIHNQIKAFSPSPCAFTSFNGKHLKIFSTSRLDNLSDKMKCGEIALCSKNRLAIQTGKGLIGIRDVQIEGKKRMKVEEFLRGTKLQIKMMFGD